MIIMENLGKKAKDKVTGFKGVVTSKVSYLTGCDQYGITPPVKENEIEDTHYFDVSRVVITEPRKPLTKRIKTDKGGPNRDAPR